MHDRRLGRTAAALACLALVITQFLPAAAHPDLRETGLQGEVPLADQLSGRSLRGYRDGLELVGKNDIHHRGANMQLAWLGDCAYVSTADLSRLGVTPPADPAIDGPLWGVAVIDASDPQRPRLVRVLHSVPTWNSWEAVATNESRGLLIISGTGTTMTIYDASSDCTDPILRSTVTLPSDSHGLRIAQDGFTAYVTFTALTAVDLTDLDHPRVIGSWPDLAAHDLDVSPDGDRLYLAGNGIPVLGFGDLVIVDSSQIQQRLPDPQPTVISTVPNGGPHTARLIHIGARAYVVTEDEVHPCPWGEARIIDVTDEVHPVVVSQFGLQVNDQANCARTVPDASLASPVVQAIMYSTHYVGFDDPQNAHIAFFTWYGAGLRAFDISDPTHPREIAYYNPPPERNLVYRQSSVGVTPLTFDLSTSYVRYRPESGTIWFVSVENGLQILRFSK